MDKNFEELELRAYENDAEAQYELAVYYKNKQNNKSYVDWLKKSAKLNNSNAKVELAELYLQGVLIDKDEDLAISLLEEELEVNKNARLVLGKYYVNTRDEENINKGLREFETAKELNKSQSTIGKEIKNNRKRRYSQTEDSPWKCKHYKDCKVCIGRCSDFEEVPCFRRDRFIGACNYRNM